jgi:hypothetical protein
MPAIGLTALLLRRAYSSRREVGSASTAGDNSPTFTVINSPWPILILALGIGTLFLVLV